MRKYFAILGLLFFGAFLLFTPSLCIKSASGHNLASENREFIAFSLNVARDCLRKGESIDYINRLGGITRPFCIVYDSTNKDLVIVGQHISTEPEIKLEHLVTALQSAFVKKGYPMVSIDKTEETSTTGMQAVTFGGGIENFDYGKILYEADVVLKDIGMGKNLKVFNIKSYFDLLKEFWYEKGYSNAVQSRFWFVSSNTVFINRQDITLLKELDIVIDTELSSTGFGNIDSVGALFASTLSEQYASLSMYYPEIKKLNQLFRLFGLSYGLSRLPESEENKEIHTALKYWLNSYKIPVIDVPKTHPLLTKSEHLKKPDDEVTITISGGIDMRLEVSDFLDGSVTALRDIVLKLRPDERSLSWVLPFDGWPVPGFSENNIINRELETTILNRISEKLGCNIDASIKRHAERLPDIKPITNWRGTTGIDRTLQNMFPHTYRPPQAMQLPEVRFAERMNNIPRRRDEYPTMQHPMYGTGGSQPPPPPPPSIGGVYLSDVAQITESGSLSAGKGKFSFIFNGNSTFLFSDEYSQFCTSLWSVYFDPTPPGVSIDPISMDTSVTKVQMVRYIGNVINNDLGRVMREADYKMKQWAVGTEVPEITGFKDVDELMSASKINYWGASRRFWFVPEGMRFTAGDGYCIFNGGRMNLKTEYIFLDNKTTKAEPADLAFAKFFTDNYQEISLKYPIYEELYNYAKHVSLANYLKQNKIPLLWFLLANKQNVVSEDSPGTVKQLVKSSRHFPGVDIVGGVDINTPKGNYVYDANAIKALNNVMQAQSKSFTGSSGIDVTRSRQPINIEIAHQELTIVKDHSLTTGTDLIGNRYQTDLSLWVNEEPSLEIVRVSNKNQDIPGEFGYAWNFLKLYSVDVLDNDSVISDGFIWKRFCTITNLINGKVDTLEFTPDKYNYLGYSPIDTLNSEFILLIPNLDGTMEVADKLGNYFIFTPEGDLSEMTLGNLRKEHIQFYIPECNPSNDKEIPLFLELGSKRVETGRYSVIQDVKLVDRESNLTTNFRINLNSNRIEYKPTSKSLYDKLSVLNTGQFILYELSGTEYHFCSNGCISDIISGEEYKVEYSYFGDGIDKFSRNLMVLELNSKESIEVSLGYYDLLLPKLFSLTDIQTGKSESFRFLESDTCICWVPVHQQSTFKALHYLTNGFYLAESKNGLDFYFDESGNLYSIISNTKNYLKSVKQDSYIAEFSYTLIANGFPVVENISVFKELERVMIYELLYKYDENGFLIETNIDYVSK
jgi:hypothetical protein